MASSDLQLVISAKDNASKTLKSISGSVSGVGSALGTMAKVGATAYAALAGALGTVGGMAIKSAADFEQTRIAIEGMTGSADEAREILQRVSDLAAETPFEFPELANATKQLMAYGFESDNAISTMTMLGDVASGLSVPIGDLAYLYGTMSAQGGAYLIDLKQYAARGIPIWEELAKITGQSMEEIMTSKDSLKATTEQVEQAFKNMTSEGGKFYNAMLRQSKSLSGLWSTMKDSLGFTLREIVGISQTGDIREGSIFDNLRNGASDFLVWVNENQGAIIAFFQGIIDHIVFVVSAVIQLRDAFAEIGKATMEWFSDTNEYWVFLTDFFIPIAERVRDTFVGAWKEIQSALEPIMPVLEMFATFLGVVLVGAVMAFVWAFEWVFKTIASIVVGFVNIFSGAIQFIQGAFTILIGVLTGDWEMMVEGFKMELDGLVTFIKGIAEIVFSPIMFNIKKFSEAFDGMIQGVKDSWTALSKWFSENPIVQTIKKVVSGDDKDGKQYGGAVTTGNPVIVGEHRPEVFVPSQSGNIRQLDQVGAGKTVTVNFNNVSVRNDSDLSSIIEVVKQTLGREQELSRLGAY